MLRLVTRRDPRREPAAAHAAPLRRAPVARARRRRRRDRRAHRRRPRQAVAARAASSTTCSPHREAPFTLDAADVRLLAAVGALMLAIALAEAAAQYFTDLWLQSAGERITPRAARRASTTTCSGSASASTSARQKGDLLTRVTERRQRHGRPVLRIARRDGPGRAAGVGHDASCCCASTRCSRSSRSRPRRCWRASASSTAARVRDRRRAVRRAQEGEIASIANEALSAMAVVKAFGSEGYESRARARAAASSGWPSGVEVARLQARFDGLGRRRARDQHRARARLRRRSASRTARSAPGELIVFASYTRKAQSPMRSFAREADEARRRDGASADRDRRAAGRRRRAARSGRTPTAARARAGDVALERRLVRLRRRRGPRCDDVSLRVAAGRAASR